MTSENSEEIKEVTDFVASALPVNSLPSEKDTINLALLIKSGHKRTVRLDSEIIGKLAKVTLFCRIFTSGP